jgi:hypothetical protein
MPKSQVNRALSATLRSVDQENEMARAIVLTSCEETVKYPQ